MTAADIYMRELYRYGCGTPLWEPDYADIHPGDVGFIQDDHFLRLFNATLPSSHSEQIFGVPNGYQPMEVSPPMRSRRRWFFPPQIMHSASVKQYDVGAELSAGDVIPAGVGFRFSCANQLGAVLVLKQQASREDLFDGKHFRSYILKNVDSWYEFADSLGFIVPEGDIFMVRGCDKTAEWALAAFENRSGEAEMFFNGAYMNVAGARVAVKGSWGHFSSGQHRSGPLSGPNPTTLNAAGFSQSANDPDSLFNQPVFLRTWRAGRRRFMLPRSIKAAAEPQEDAQKPERRAPNDSGTACSPADDVIIELNPNPDVARHPLITLLQYILQNSTAGVAIVTDDDLYNLFEDKGMPEITTTVLERIAPWLTIHDGLGTLTGDKEVNKTPPRGGGALRNAQTLAIATALENENRRPASKESHESLPMARKNFSDPAPPSGVKLAARALKHPRFSKANPGPSTDLNTVTNAAKLSVAQQPFTSGKVHVAPVYKDPSKYETDLVEDLSDDDGSWEEPSPEEVAQASVISDVSLKHGEEEAQVQRDMFKKLPKSSYSNIGRAQSTSLLSQLLRPDPQIPPDHPYRQRRFLRKKVVQIPSSVRMSQMGSVQVLANFAQSAEHTQLPSSSSSPSPSSMSCISLSQAAAVTSQVTPSFTGSRFGKAKNARTSSMYPGMTGEDRSEIEEEHGYKEVQISRSLAQQKLYDIAVSEWKRKEVGGAPAPDAAGAATPPPPQMQSATRSATAPVVIPVNHPYNLPAPEPPMTPRTTRRQMLSTELSESLRQNLIRERQVSMGRTEANARRRSGSFDTGMPPPMPTDQHPPSMHNVEDVKDEVMRQGQPTQKGNRDEGFQYAGW